MTKIEWTDETWNPFSGCTVHSPGCTNCYAQRIAGSPRLCNHPLYVGVTTPSKAGPVFNGKLGAQPPEHAVWTWPLRWRGSKMPKLGQGKRSMIFVGDMSDLFHKDRPRDVIDRTIAAIIHSKHIGQILTKRADVMRAYFSELKESGRWSEFPHPLFGVPNFSPDATYDEVFSRMWLGVSAEDQARANERIPDLLDTPAAVRFVSAEPLLGRINFECLEQQHSNAPGLYDLTNALLGRLVEYSNIFGGCLPNDDGDPETWRRVPKLDWIITGGESGPNARPMHPDWARSIRDQCAAAGVPFFFKQWGEWCPVTETGFNDKDRFPEHTFGSGKFIKTFGGPVETGTLVRRIGKRRAGRFLDGVEHNGFPS